MSDIEWAAGFIDGEGCIGVYDYYDNRAQRRYPTPVIEVGNTEIEPLLKLKEMFGGFIATRSPLKNPLGKKTIFRWICRHRIALKVAKAILPFLRTNKREGAEAIIKHYA